mgnify:FL=1
MCFLVVAKGLKRLDHAEYDCDRARVVAKARRWVGQRSQYSMKENNCEHFVTGCKGILHGFGWSWQTRCKGTVNYGGIDIDNKALLSIPNPADEGKWIAGIKPQQTSDMGHETVPQGNQQLMILEMNNVPEFEDSSDDNDEELEGAVGGRREGQIDEPADFEDFVY